MESWVFSCNIFFLLSYEKYVVLWFPCFLKELWLNPAASCSSFPYFCIWVSENLSLWQTKHKKSFQAFLSSSHVCRKQSIKWEIFFAAVWQPQMGIRFVWKSVIFLIWSQSFHKSSKGKSFENLSPFFVDINQNWDHSFYFNPSILLKPLLFNFQLFLQDELNP